MCFICEGNDVSAFPNLSVAVVVECCEHVLLNVLISNQHVQNIYHMIHNDTKMKKFIKIEMNDRINWVLLITGRSPVWILRCRVKSLLPPNARPQNKHTNGLSPVN